MRNRLFLALLTIFVLVLLSDSRQFTSAIATRSPRTAYVHLFEWKWNDVAQECETFLGPKGFAAVQISPASEHAVIAHEDYPWWQRYQPVSYQINSRSGDRTQFRGMIDRCRRSGVEVYADAVINHMSGEAQGVGSAGTRFTKYFYPNLYQSRDFHTCRRDITDYNNHEEVTNCELVSLPDLATGSEYVRDRLAAYLRDLVSLGVRGFRIDAAKHIHTNDIAAILDRLHASVEPDPYIYQEVIDPGNEAVKKSEYYPNGDVIEFEYGRKVSEKFLGIDGQTLAQLESLGESWGFAPSEKALVFIDNHDKQRGHGGGGSYLTYKNGKLYDLANVFMLAFPYGYPQVMSSFAFDNADQGPPADAQGRTRSVHSRNPATCDQGWVCEHRHRSIANMVAFRNATDPTFYLSDWWSNGSNQIAFGRGDRGFVIINRESQPLDRTFQTSLPAGTYCDVIHAELDRCGDSAITVNSTGQVTVSVAAMDAIAIHINAKL
ncbi:alpha-amylase family protein [Microcoleus sp. FACHB-1515]|uniref:alpha-amylase n=1 Tax=Cyanophyceae TaxID=3028117 RepID=UPI001688548E|nr:alpha-amylase family protein [Microcoleus sp. FACHB-1515]MBD2093028.1 alpha-amylase family protein [Microcoleus sp. FACHB-1515]